MEGNIKTSTPYTFNESLLAKDDVLLIPEHVLLSIFKENSKYGQRLAEFVKRNPERVTLTSASIWFDGKQAVTNLH